MWHRVRLRVPHGHDQQTLGRLRFSLAEYGLLFRNKCFQVVRELRHR